MESCSFQQQEKRPLTYVWGRTLVKPKCVAARVMVLENEHADSLMLRWVGQFTLTPGSGCISTAHGKQRVDLLWEKQKPTDSLIHWHTDPQTHCLLFATKILILYSTHNPTNPLGRVKVSVRLAPRSVMTGQDGKKLSHRLSFLPATSAKQ